MNIIGSIYIKARRTQFRTLGCYPASLLAKVGAHWDEIQIADYIFSFFSVG